MTIKSNEQDPRSPLYHTFHHELSYFGSRPDIKRLSCNKASSTFSIVYEYKDPDGGESDPKVRLVLFNANMVGVNNLRVIHSARALDLEYSRG